MHSFSPFGCACVESAGISDNRTFAMAPSYIHFYLLDCRQDLFNKEQSSSQDRPAAGQYICAYW